MGKTRHMHARMSQRGIQGEMVDLALRYGVEKDDKVILNKKGLKALLTELQSTQKFVQKMMERGGLVVVESRGSEITTYRLNSYKPSLMR